MAEKITFESYERRIDKVNKALNENGIASLEEAKEICDKAGIDPYKTVEETQPIAFENAKWAYVAGAAIAIKRVVKLPLMQQKLSESVCRHSVFPVLLQKTEKSV